jgi:23S rRNA (pseudouridine1915-N3)-methyltransferase
MQIQVIQIGKTKHSFIEEGVQEYLKRLWASAEITIDTLKEFSIDDSSNAALRSKAIEQEGQAILNKIKNGSYVIALDEQGKQFNSHEFAQKINQIRDQEGGKITFVIGGPFGLSEAVKQRADLVLSFSKFTFTHEQIRLLLFEQVYRAFTILANKTYHY